MVDQAQDTMNRCDGLLALKKEYQQAIVNGGGTSLRFHRTLENLFKFPVVSVPDLAQFHGTTYPTAKADIELLVKVGILEELEEARHPRVYYSPKIISLAYDDENS